MNSIKEAAARKHYINSPLRLDSSRCGKNVIPANDFNQSSYVPMANIKPEVKKVNQEVIRKDEEFSAIEQVVMQGDLSKLNPEQRVMYYRKVCESSGLNPYTNPFAYILLNGKLTLYAKKDCTEQLRKIHGVSIEELDEKLIDDVYIVTAKAKDKGGRIDQAKGAVVIGHLKGEAKANAIMKAETKAKRRVTLSICGMGWTDESEIESIPNATHVDVDLGTGEINDVKTVEAEVKFIETPKNKISLEQKDELLALLDECNKEYKEKVFAYIKKHYCADKLEDLPSELFDTIKKAAVAKREENLAILQAEEEYALMTRGS